MPLRIAHSRFPRLLNQWGVLEKRNTLWFSLFPHRLVLPKRPRGFKFLSSILVRPKMGLTWDLLGTHIPLRADGFVSVTLSWITSQRYGFSGTWQTVVPPLEQVLSRRLCFGRISYSSYRLQLIEFHPTRHTLDDEVLASALLERLLYICLLHLFSFKFPSFPLCALRETKGIRRCK